MYNNSSELTDVQVLSCILGLDQILSAGSANCSWRSSSDVCLPGDFKKLYEVDPGFGIPLDVHLGMPSIVGR